MDENEVLDQQIQDAWDGDEPETAGESVPEAETGGTGAGGGTPEAGQAPEEEPPQGEEVRADQPETFTLKHLDETRTVTRDELVALAQKGLDYDRVRPKYDELQQYRQQADPALSLVRAYAEKNGMSVEQYVDFCRRQELVAQGVNEATADAQIAVEKRQAQLDAQTRADQEDRQRREELERQTQERQEARRRDMTAFLEAFPGVKGEDVPREVWAQVAAGQSLVTAYTLYENRRLQAELAARKQNEANAGKTIGSLGSPQGEKMGKTLGDYWDEAGE